MFKLFKRTTSIFFGALSVILAFAELIEAAIYLMCVAIYLDMPEDKS